LAEIGPSGVQAVCDSLTNQDFGVRLDLVRVLDAQMGSNRLVAMPAVRASLFDTSSIIRIAATNALRRVSDRPPESNGIFFFKTNP